MLSAALQPDTLPRSGEPDSTSRSWTWRTDV